MRVLVLASRIPFPLEKGDKLRIYHQLGALSATDEVILCCLSSKPPSEEQLNALAPWAREVHVLRLSLLRRMWRMIWAWTSALPFQVTWFTETKAKRQLHTLIDRHQPDVIYCQLVRCAEYVRELHHIPKVLDYMDALSAGMHRRAHTEQRPLARWMRWLMRAEGTRLARYESRVFDYFDAHTIISRNDRLLIPHRDRDGIHLVPNGVDLKAFTPGTQPKSDPPVLLFTGNMSYAPNVDAAHHLVEDILPLIQHPHVRVVLAGAEPTASVRALASERVHVTGWVDDIAAEYQRATLFVAPLRMGTGLQNKVLEAMASDLPCVLSPHAFAPLGLPSAGHAEVCHDAHAFAQRIDALLLDPIRAVDLAHQARTKIQEKFSWEGHGKTLRSILSDAAQLK